MPPWFANCAIRHNFDDNYFMLFMKRQLVLAAVFFIAVFTGCKSGGPDAVAEKYLNAMMRMDFETAKNVSTDETKRIIGTVEQVSANSVPDSIKQTKKTVKIKIVSTEIKGDEATVTYTTSESAAQMKVFLVKQKERWLVEASKIDEFNRAGVDTDMGAGTDAPADSTAPVTTAIPDTVRD
jgi:hypothetical protein